MIKLIKKTNSGIELNLINQVFHDQKLISALDKSANERIASEVVSRKIGDKSIYENLYHYTSLDAFSKIIQRKKGITTLWATEAEFLNDNLETKKLERSLEVVLRKFECQTTEIEEVTKNAASSIYDLNMEMNLTPDFLIDDTSETIDEYETNRIKGDGGRKTTMENSGLEKFVVDPMKLLEEEIDEFFDEYKTESSSGKKDKEDVKIFTKAKNDHVILDEISDVSDQEIASNYEFGYFDLIKASLAEVIEVTAFRTFLNLVKYDEVRKSKTKYYVISLSKDEDALPMWLYYADNHGICLNFEMSGFEMDEKFYIGDIYYEHDEHDMILDNAIRLFREDFIYKCELVNDNMWNSVLTERFRYKEIKELPMAISDYVGEIVDATSRRLQKRYIEQLRMLSYFFKDSGFRHEKEVRIIFEEKKPINFRCREQYVIPYIEVNYDGKLPIREIIYSPLTRDEEVVKDGIRRILEENQYIETKQTENKLIEIKKSSVSLRY